MRHENFYSMRAKFGRFYFQSMPKLNDLQTGSNIVNKNNRNWAALKK